MEEYLGRERQYTVSVLLTKYSDLFSDFIYWISGRGYTHASLSLDEDDENCFYSFNYRGFCEEMPKRRRPKSLQAESICYRLQVSEEVYRQLQERIEDIKMRKRQYRYSRLGVLLCLLHIPHKLRNQYFCSQFVAEILSDTGVITLKKDASLYLPNHFVKEIMYQQGLVQTVYDAV